MVTLLIAVAGCATGQAVSRGDTAAKNGDWDSAVAYYRQALGSDPERIDVKISLERATRMAAAGHVQRARELEAQDQLPGAIAEYRLAADLDRGSTLAVSKAAELERKLQAQAEAARPLPRIEALQEQNRQASTIPRLDPRTRVPSMRYVNPVAVRDLLSTISALTGINVTYDANLEGLLGRGYSLDVQDVSLESVLNQILSANQLTFKVIDQRTIFVYQDTVTNRGKFEDQYVQTFYLSNADPQEISQILNQMVQQGPAVRPNFFVNKGANSLVVRATAPVMEIVDHIIRANDRPRPEVMIEAEILEVDRTFMRQLGIDLSQYAIGFTFSPEVAPPNTATVPGAFPTQPPPFNLNTITRGVSAADAYITSPTALIRLLESNQNTKILARPQIRGRDNETVTLNLGELVPIPQTVFQTQGGLGGANIPTTNVQYQSVGVNLVFTPRVTYQDEIILDSLTLENSALGSNLNIGGQTFPTITTRRAATSVRLRDGEPNLLAGLLKEADRTTLRGLPGIMQLPILRSLFGNTDTQAESTDIVMIITPRIVRTRDLTAADLKPFYIGTGQNFGSSATPQLISPNAPPAPQPGGPGGAAAPGAPTAGAPAGVPVTPPLVPDPTTAGAAAPPVAPPPAGVPPPRAPGVVPIQPVDSTGAPMTDPQGAVQVTITVPAGADGALPPGGGPHTVPISIANASQVGTLTLTITYDSRVLRAVGVTQGTFMSQGGVNATFVPRIDPAAGRIDIAVSRPAGAAGASGGGIVGAITFSTVAPGSSQISATGVATTPTGQSLAVRTTPASAVVR